MCVLLANKSRRLTDFGEASVVDDVVQCSGQIVDSFEELGGGLSQSRLTDGGLVDQATTLATTAALLCPVISHL